MGCGRSFGLPGMRILQFAFGGAQEDRFLPHHFEQHTVVYTGTHDNETTAGWFEHLTARNEPFSIAMRPCAAAIRPGTLIRAGLGLGG